MTSMAAATTWFGVAASGVGTLTRSLRSSPLSTLTGAPLVPDPPMSRPNTPSCLLLRRDESNRYSNRHSQLHVWGQSLRNLWACCCADKARELGFAEFYILAGIGCQMLSKRVSPT
jgi:hypothetical protein